MGAYMDTKPTMEKYVKRLIQANDLKEGHYLVETKTGFDASQHPIFK